VCGVNRGISEVITKEWYARCYDCRWRRWYGLNKDIAISAKNGHWKKHNHRTSHGERDRPAALEAKQIVDRRGGGVEMPRYRSEDMVIVECQHLTLGGAILKIGRTYTTLCKYCNEPKKILRRATAQDLVNPQRKTV